MASSTHFYSLMSDDNSETSFPTIRSSSSVLEYWIAMEMVISESLGIAFMAQVDGQSTGFIGQEIRQIGSNTNNRFSLGVDGVITAKIAIARSAPIAAIAHGDSVWILKFDGGTPELERNSWGLSANFDKLCAVCIWNTSNYTLHASFNSINGEEITALFVSETNIIHFVSGKNLTKISRFSDLYVRLRRKLFIPF